MKTTKLCFFFLRFLLLLLWLFINTSLISLQCSVCRFYVGFNGIFQRCFVFLFSFYVTWFWFLLQQIGNQAIFSSSKSRKTRRIFVEHFQEHIQQNFFHLTKWNFFELAPLAVEMNEKTTFCQIYESKIM